MKTLLLITLAASLQPALLQAEILPMAKPLESAANERIYAYKKTPQGELKVNVYLPEGWHPGQKHPAILMFFGGGFVNGTPAQFTTKAQYLASRGLVALTPEYRVKNRHQTGPDASIEDAKSAMRWARTNAAALGIDPDRIVASGGSAGGTCAALTALTSSFEPAGEDTTVSSKPGALVLYNPALVPAGTQDPQLAPMKDVLTAWKVSKGDPPMIFFFGTNDKLLAGSLVVAKQEVAAGNRAELYTAPGVGHGFFNDSATAKNGVPGWHAAVLYQTDVFLASLGYLSGPPTIHPDPSKKLTKVDLH